MFGVAHINLTFRLSLINVRQMEGNALWLLHIVYIVRFLGAFAKLRKAIISFVMFVRSYVRLE
jgi:hypothetical protein